MKTRNRCFPGFVAWAFLLTGQFGLCAADRYGDPPPPVLDIAPISDGQARISVTPYPSADQYQLWRADGLGLPWVEDSGGSLSNLVWITGAGGAKGFYRVAAQPLGSNALLTATVLNRLAYGPTPELLDRLAISGPEAWIQEQLNPETVSERAALAHTNIAFIQSRFGSPTDPVIDSAQVNSGPGTAGILELQAWLALNAVFADRQLLEVLTQFWENHFVTYAAKSANFFAGAQFRDAYPQRAATDLEWREVSRWRQVLMTSTGTFYDLLRISAESAAMILYLDTATSRGNPPNIPNENYSRELLELFTMGVDNGYDQSDITNMAPCWTGWTPELVSVANAYNPFAPRSTIRKSPTGPNALTNLVGVWTMNFKQNFHASHPKTIFGGKTVPARFGAPYTTRIYSAGAPPGSYQLDIPARAGTNGFQDGYDVIAHLAKLPFTQEYISVKLCRWFVHDEFHTGYDFTDPDLSEEAKLVKACLAAWDSSGGQLRPVLSTIFSSALFRGHGANAHKVKTPLEFAASAVRALRQSANGTGLHGSWTAVTDGYGFVNSQGGGQRGGLGSVLMRMGSMSLFNREEPDGYPEAGEAWVSAGALAERIRFLSSLLKAPGQPGKNDANNVLNNNLTDPVRLLQSRLPSTVDQRDAGKVTDLFLALIHPGEGRASLNYYRNIMMQYLNMADDGVTSSPLADLTPSNVAGSVYDTRVRGMVAALLGLQRFQEQ